MEERKFDSGLMAGPIEFTQSRTRSALKRAYDLLGSVLGLLLVGPLGILIAAAVKLSDGGPVFYRQVRVGRNGRLFKILKFRSMVCQAEQAGPSVTRDADPRITRIGRILRKTKLDELPQLWNVMRGEMSFVGPRPEVPRFVECYTAEQRQILRFKPGITDLATLVFRDEEALLRNSVNVEEFYIEHCIPRKLGLNLEYAQRANLLQDTVLIFQTLCPYWLGIACGYAVALSGSLWLAYQLRFDFNIPPTEFRIWLRACPIVVTLQMLVLFWRRQFVGLLSYFDVLELKQLTAGLSIGAVVQYLLWIALAGRWMPARSIIFTDFVVAFLILVGIRTLLRSLRESRAVRVRESAGQRRSLRVGLVGAGEMGAWLIQQLNHKGNGHHRVEVVFDDDPSKWNRQLHGIPVVGMPECILNGTWRERLDEVIVAIGDANPERLKEIKAIAGSANLRARTMPSVKEMLSDAL